MFFEICYMPIKSFIDISARLPNMLTGTPSGMATKINRPTWCNTIKNLFRHSHNNLVLSRKKHFSFDIFYIYTYNQI